jgi:hypothetical protein
MARGLINYINIDAPDSDYPDGRVRNNNGSGNGTPLTELELGDYHQFFAKMMREAGITPNGLPDNEYTGHQYFDALRKAAPRYKSYVATIHQSGSSAPVATIIDNDIGNIVWTRTGPGVYVATLSGAFTSGKFFINCPSITPAALGFIGVNPINPHSFNLLTYDFAGNQADGIISSLGVPLEVRVYH